MTINSEDDINLDLLQQNIDMLVKDIAFLIS